MAQALTTARSKVLENAPSIFPGVPANELLTPESRKASASVKALLKDKAFMFANENSRNRPGYLRNGCLLRVSNTTELKHHTHFSMFQTCKLIFHGPGALRGSTAHTRPKNSELWGMTGKHGTGITYGCIATAVILVRCVDDWL